MTVTTTIRTPNSGDFSVADHSVTADGARPDASPLNHGAERVVIQRAAPEASAAERRIDLQAASSGAPRDAQPGNEPVQVVQHSSPSLHQQGQHSSPSLHQQG